MHSRHIATSRRALFQVFVHPALRASTAPHPAQRQDACMLRAPRTQSTLLPSISRRSISQYAKVTRQPDPLAAALNDPAHPVDEAIAATSHSVHVVGASGTISAPQPLAELLARLDRGTQLLKQVGTNPHTGLAVAKLYARSELRAEALGKRERRRAAVRSAPVKKHIELSWSIDPHDLAHRVRKIQEFLHEGRAVEVLIAPKKRARKATEEEITGLMKELRSIEGSEEADEMEGKPGRVATIFLRPKKGLATAAETNSKAGEAGDSKLDRLQKKEQKKAEEKEKTEKRMARKRQAEDEKAKVAPSEPGPVAW